MIPVANEALKVQRSLECEVAALQQTMLSMQNQSQINSSAISGYQEGALWANHWLKRKDLCNIISIMVHYVVKEVFMTIKLVFLLKMLVIIMLFVLQLSTFLFDEVLMISNTYLTLESSQALL